MAGAVWGALLFVFCGWEIHQPPPTWGAWAALAIAAVFVALALGALASLVSLGASRLLFAELWLRGFDFVQALLAGIAAGWALLSLVKFQATRSHLSILDLRFLLGSLRQVGAEATVAERRIVYVAIALVATTTVALFAALRHRSHTARASGSPRATGGLRVAILLAVAIAGLLTVAFRQPYARFVLSQVDPATSFVARWISGAGTMSRAPARAFTPDARHRRIQPYVAPADFRKSNIVVLMLESVPWSRLFGPLARPEATPRLAALAAESTVFDRAYAVATHSDYAQTSILASLHPRRYERHDFFARLEYPRTLPWDLLGPLGYRSAVFSCQNEGWGNMKAFLQTPRLETFRHAPDWPEAPRRGEGSEAKVFERTPVSGFLAWVAAAPKKPFVAYLNFQATHAPYVIPEGEQEPFQPAAIDFPITYVSYPVEKTPVMENRFYNALASVDRAAGELVDGLAAAGVWDDTVLLVVSDHGEAFYEHGQPAHGTTLFEEQLRTAMLIRLPGEPPRRIAAPVSVLDAMPSIYRFLGLPEHGNLQGRSDAFVEAPDSARPRPLPVTIQGMTHEDGLLLGDWKLIVNWDRDERRLYDLAADPLERADRADAEPERTAALDRELTSLLLDQLAYYRERGWESGYYPPRLP